MRRTEEIVFSVIFRKGLADRNRLPLTHVITTLREIDFMIREVGIKVQREAGVENPDGDFGVQLLAGSTGIAFAKGSFKTASALTRDITNGRETLSRIIQTTNVIETKKTISVDDYRAPVLRRLAKISDIQAEDKTELGMQVVGGGKIERGKFSERGVEAIQKMGKAPDFAVESVTLFGKLRQLLDRSRTGKEDDFWGELIEDNGNRWNIKFKPHHLGRIKNLFTKQVIASGNAVYFKTRNPRLDVDEIDEDEERDYLVAFDHFSEEYEEIFGDRDPDQILKDIRG